MTMPMPSEYMRPGTEMGTVTVSTGAWHETNYPLRQTMPCQVCQHLFSISHFDYTSVHSPPLVSSTTSLTPAGHPLMTVP